MDNTSETTPEEYSPPPPQAQPVPVKKTPERKRGLSLTEEDTEYLDKILGDLPPSRTLEKLRAVAKTGQAGSYLYADDTDLSSLHAVMNIIHKYQPTVDHEGFITQESLGDYDDINSIDKDSLYIETLNATLGGVMGKLTAQAEAAKMEIEFAKSQLRTELRRVKNTARFKGKITDDQIQERSRVHKRFVETVETWIATNELARVVSSVYYSAQRVSDKLKDRAKTLLSQWGRDCHGTQDRR